MNDVKEQKRDWKIFYFPPMIVLMGYVLYGKIENMLGKSTITNSDYILYYILISIMFLTFGIGYIIYFKFLTKNQEGNKNLKVIYAAILALIISFIIYSVVVEFQGAGVSDSGHLYIPPLEIPNIFPWFVSVGEYSSVIELNWYHIFIFFLFFPIICYGFMAMDYLHFKSKLRTFRMLVMFFGANLLGLMWQDFYYFVSDPNIYLEPGDRYGVYFNQWLGPIPTLYIVTNLLGLGFMWFAVSIKSGVKYRDIYRFLIFISVILVIGVTIHTVKIPFIS